MGNVLLVTTDRRVIAEFDALAAVYREYECDEVAESDDQQKLLRFKQLTEET